MTIDDFVQFVSDGNHDTYEEGDLKSRVDDGGDNAGHKLEVDTVTLILTTHIIITVIFVTVIIITVIIITAIVNVINIIIELICLRGIRITIIFNQSPQSPDHI